MIDETPRPYKSKSPCDAPRIAISSSVTAEHVFLRRGAMLPSKYRGGGLQFCGRPSPLHDDRHAVPHGRRAANWPARLPAAPASLRAAAEISRAEVTGAELGSLAIAFHPGKIRPGAYSFVVGTAGSATLVLQTVLPALLQADGPSTIALEGGTHNPFAPPFDFLARAFLPLVNRMDLRHGEARAPGLHPWRREAHVDIDPAPRLHRLDLLERGPLRALCGRALVASVGERVAERELVVLGERLRIPSESLHREVLTNGPGNVVFVEVDSEHVTEVFTAFGERGVPAEIVATRAADEALGYLGAEVPVGEHLAEQLLVPMALAGGGAFRTGRAFLAHPPHAGRRDPRVPPLETRMTQVARSPGRSSGSALTAFRPRGAADLGDGEPCICVPAVDRGERSRQHPVDVERPSRWSISCWSIRAGQPLISRATGVPRLVEPGELDREVSLTGPRTRRR